MESLCFQKRYIDFSLESGIYVCQEGGVKKYTQIGRKGISDGDVVRNLVRSQSHFQVKDIISQFIIITRYVSYF